MYFEPQINFLYKINKSSKLRFISQKSYGFCVFYKILNHNIYNSEISLTGLHNSILGNKPTILSLTTYIKSCSPLYELKTSNIKKTLKHIIIHNEAVIEFKEITKAYLKELKNKDDEYNHFFESTKW